MLINAKFTSNYLKSPRIWKIINNDSELIIELNNTNQNLFLLKISGSKSDMKKLLRKKTTSPKSGYFASNRESWPRDEK